MLRLLCRQAVQTSRSSLAGVQSITTRNLAEDTRAVDPKVENMLQNEYSTTKCSLLGRVASFNEETDDFIRFQIVVDTLNRKSFHTCFQFKDNIRQATPRVGDRFLVSGDIVMSSNPDHAGSMFVKTRNASVINRKRQPRPEMEG